ncbi:MAG: NADH-quinone oxidoreductase subunit C [Nitriliruptorales bacterium]|nr:NADH-quinone oxidoreductase subunit C [Nitriliruptorales bacterium]
MTDPNSTRKGADSASTRPTGAGPERSTPDMHGGEEARMRDHDVEVSVQLTDQLRALRDHLVDAFDDLEVVGFRGELTLLARPDRIFELLSFCRDDPDVRCELLADLTGVHWPGGKRVENQQETTGWPNYEYGQEIGRIEANYVLYSLTHNHRFRITVQLPDAEPVIASATPLYASADFMEREMYDFFGVHFDGHPNLKRLHMPDDWNGHPLRKDYPLGGVDVQYKGATVPPPDRRHY